MKSSGWSINTLCSFLHIKHEHFINMYKTLEFGHLSNHLFKPWRNRNLEVKWLDQIITETFSALVNCGMYLMILHFSQQNSVCPCIPCGIYVTLATFSSIYSLSNGTTLFFDAITYRFWSPGKSVKDALVFTKRTLTSNTGILLSLSA